MDKQFVFNLLILAISTMLSVCAFLLIQVFKKIYEIDKETIELKINEAKQDGKIEGLGNRVNIIEKKVL